MVQLRANGMEEVIPPWHTSIGLLLVGELWGNEGEYIVGEGDERI